MNRPTITNRGFAHFEPVQSDSRGSVRVYESSAATQPCIWLNAVGYDGGDATVHLPLGEVVVLRDQLTWLIENHYHIKPRTEAPNA